MSSVAFTGNVAVAPELAYTPGGRPFARLVVAENLGHRDRTSGEWVEDPANFWPVTAWGEWAEYLVESIGKGDRVSVIGRTRTNTWVTDAGEKRSRLEIVADDVAASVRFAKVKIARVRRTEPSDSPDADPWTAPEAVGASVAGDEPPF